MKPRTAAGIRTLDATYAFYKIHGYPAYAFYKIHGYPAYAFYEQQQ